MLLLCFAHAATAQILVGTNGSVVQTVAVAPPFSKWATTNLSGVGREYQTPEALDAAVQTFDETAGTWLSKPIIPQYLQQLLTWPAGATQKNPF